MLYEYSDGKAGWVLIGRNQDGIGTGRSPNPMPGALSQKEFRRGSRDLRRLCECQHLYANGVRAFIYWELGQTGQVQAIDELGSC